MWNYYRNEVNDSAYENHDANKYIKSFECNTKIILRTRDDNKIVDVEIVVPLKYLSNFWKSLDLPLTSCEIERDLPWSRYFIMSETSKTPAVPANAPFPPL